MKYTFATKLCANLSNFNILSLNFFANILILIVLTDSTIQMLCYMRSYGVNFDKSEILKFLKGPEGWVPPKNFKFLFAKN